MKSVFRPFPLPLTGKQWFYLGVIQGLGAGLIDGGANFGIAYAMYHGQDVVKMWVFSQNTIAGDLGVTPIIQCLASMLITSTLVHTDLHSHQIQPLPFCYPHVENLPDPRTLFKRRGSERRSSEDTAAGTPATDSTANQGTSLEKAPKGAVTGDSPPLKRGFWYYYWMLVRFVFEGTEKNMLAARPGFRNWWGRFLWTAAQGAAIGIIFGFPIWCLAIVILGPIYGTGNMGDKWAPQVIKLVYGAIVGWVTNPVIAILALGSQAEQSLLVVEHDVESGSTVAGGQEEEDRQETLQDALEHPPTILEDEELNVTRDRSGSQAFSLSSPRRASSLLPPPTTPNLGRSRANSNASMQGGRSPAASLRSRPPIVQNVSYLAPLPLATPLSALDAALSPPIWTASSFNRPRRGTVSSESDSVRSYSYALGGTGGRAQRSRSNTATSIVPPVIVTPGMEDPRTAFSVQSQPPRMGSYVADRTTRSAGGSFAAPTPPHTAPPAAWDVFGRPESGPGLSRPRQGSTGPPARAE